MLDTVLVYQVVGINSLFVVGFSNCRLPTVARLTGGKTHFACGNVPLGPGMFIGMKMLYTRELAVPNDEPWFGQDTSNPQLPKISC